MRALLWPLAALALVGLVVWISLISDPDPMQRGSAVRTEGPSSAAPNNDPRTQTLAVNEVIDKADLRSASKTPSPAIEGAGLAVDSAKQRETQVVVPASPRDVFVQAQAESEGNKLGEGATAPELGNRQAGEETAKPAMESEQVQGGEAVPERTSRPAAIDLAGFEEERKRVEDDLAEDAGFSRQDLLVMYGRTSAGSGQFELAAAAYMMFLDEFGTDHPYSSAAAMKLADCLAPLNLDSIDVLHLTEGPEYRPQWRMGHMPVRQRLDQAISVYELAAELAAEPAGAGVALLRMGWVHRALGEWDAATRVWDQCAAEAPGSSSAEQALWLAAENLDWTGQPSAASLRLEQLATEYSESARASQALDWAEDLHAAEARTAAFMQDPIGSLEDEIAERPHRTEWQVYYSVSNWLRQRGATDARVAIARWAVGRTAWSVETRMACHYDLIDLLLELDSRPEAPLEAAALLRDVASMAPEDGWAVPPALQRARMLEDLGRGEEADATLEGIAARVGASPAYEPSILAEHIKLLLDRGERERAQILFDKLSESYPDHSLTEELAPSFSGVDEGEE